MKKGLVLAAALVGCLVSNMSVAKKRVKAPDDVERVESTQPLCEKGVCGQPTSECSCYCSKMCGPREITKKDKPRYVKKNSKGQAIPERCYCQTWDVEVYKERCEAKEQGGAATEVVETTQEAEGDEAAE